MNHLVEIYTTDELYESLVDYEADDSFASIEETKERIRYFTLNGDYANEQHLFFVVKGTKGELIGVAKVKISGAYSLSHKAYNKWISFISVDKQHWGKGIAKALIKSIMKYAAENKFDLLGSGYSLRGWMYLRPILHRYAKVYKVTFCDDAVKPEFYHSDGEGWSNEEYNRLWDEYRYTAI